MNDLHWINFNDLRNTEGGFSKLYCDYVNDFQKVKQYFEVDFHFLQSFSAHAERLRRQVRHRTTLVEVLEEQNRAYGSSDKTLEHIHQLAEENTFAIVTGQQVGILGGPLYTVYKTITAVKLARQLHEAHPQYNFVPVFWLEGEDHDFEEVNKVGLLNNEHQPVTIEYLLKGKKIQKNLGAVGEIELNGSLDLFFDQLQKTLTNSEFRESILQTIRKTYTPSSTFNRAFAQLMNSLFEDEGLVFISSNDRRLKQLLSSVFLKEINEFPRVSQLIIQQSAELEVNYHAQMKTKAMNLFLFYKGGRYFIEPRENDFALRGTRQYFSKEELIRMVEENPEMISPNVALRPICQDTILPTLAYVGGPSEVAYFAQLKPVYQYYDLTMPIIYPRASATVLEERQLKIMEKYQLDVMEFFENYRSINDKVIQLISEVTIDDMFTEAAQRIADTLNEMRFGLNYIDPTLMGPLESTRERIDGHLTALKQRANDAQKRKHEVALRQVQKVVNQIMPNGNLQEREFNIIYFLNKHGLEFTKWLLGELQITQFKHQILHV
ncbi:MAG: bacillithiol biosynthesis cysteine-adding enzyme BshC [Ignavibacteriae bacterium]|nr:bacillithiol biosynthesis cysteine-adding enzyme BshC [Ignavibacteria bacterium]MBI3363682.1 bacillithiol biosynthesis cysteine-adding enzyme BshC [Ignavibacteriota bacterium]